MPELTAVLSWTKLAHVCMVFSTLVGECYLCSVYIISQRGLVLCQRFSGLMFLFDFSLEEKEDRVLIL